MATDKKWFVIMYQQEIEQFKEGEHFERLIYESIKSYSGNGKNAVALSIRDISRRSNTSIPTVHRILPKLIQKNLVEIIGEETRVGGTVNIYKVFHHGTASVPPRDTLSKESVPTREESVPTREESVPSPASNLDNIKKKESNKGDRDYFFNGQHLSWEQLKSKVTPEQLEQFLEQDKEMRVLEQL